MNQCRPGDRDSHRRKQPPWTALVALLAMGLLGSGCAPRTLVLKPDAPVAVAAAQPAPRPDPGVAPPPAPPARPSCYPDAGYRGPDKALVLLTQIPPPPDRPDSSPVLPRHFPLSLALPILGAPARTLCTPADVGEAMRWATRGGHRVVLSGRWLPAPPGVEATGPGEKTLPWLEVTFQVPLHRSWADPWDDERRQAPEGIEGPLKRVWRPEVFSIGPLPPDELTAVDEVLIALLYRELEDEPRPEPGLEVQIGWRAPWPESTPGSSARRIEALAARLEKRGLNARSLRLLAARLFPKAQQADSLRNLELFQRGCDQVLCQKDRLRAEGDLALERGQYSEAADRFRALLALVDPGKSPAEWAGVQLRLADALAFQSGRSSSPDVGAGEELLKTLELAAASLADQPYGTWEASIRARLATLNPSDAEGAAEYDRAAELAIREGELEFALSLRQSALKRRLKGGTIEALRRSMEAVEQAAAALKQANGLAPKSFWNARNPTSFEHQLEDVACEMASSRSLAEMEQMVGELSRGRGLPVEPTVAEALRIAARCLPAKAQEEGRSSAYLWRALELTRDPSSRSSVIDELISTATATENPARLKEVWSRLEPADRKRVTVMVNSDAVAALLLAGDLELADELLRAGGATSAISELVLLRGEKLLSEGHPEQAYQILEPTIRAFEHEGSWCCSDGEQTSLFRVQTALLDLGARAAAAAGLQEQSRICLEQILGRYDFALRNGNSKEKIWRVGVLDRLGQLDTAQGLRPQALWAFTEATSSPWLSRDAAWQRGLQQRLRTAQQSPPPRP